MTEPLPESAPTNGPEPAAPPARRPRPARTAAVAGAALLAAAVLGGAGYTVVAVQGADRDPGRPTWKLPADAEDRTTDGAAEQTGLKAMFLPFGEDGYSPGPDVGEYGNDAELSGARAAALQKESLRDLPGTTRRRLQQQVDKQRIQGMAMRSYNVNFGYAASGGDTFTVSVTLERMANRTAVRDLSTLYTGLLDATDVFREAPAIKGHKDARCFLTPKAKKNGLEGAICSGYVGDVLVSAYASGPRPLSAADVGTFFTAQLDRIHNPGQAV
ncbi:hypothetical protein [Streptomyces longwoodensis]|uniref:hypothetical protein n=1 Tax=Streptomyces longwoodensis TaxID=68231 RepID=UPI0033CA9448